MVFFSHNFQESFSVWISFVVLVLLRISKYLSEEVHVCSLQTRRKCFSSMHLLLEQTTINDFVEVDTKDGKTGLCIWTLNHLQVRPWISSLSDFLFCFVFVGSVDVDLQNRICVH